MAERYGGDYIDSILSNATAVTDLVSTRIYEGTKVPQSVTEKSTINYYKTGPYDGRIEWFEARWSIDCRAETYTESRNIASVVFDSINRVTATVNSKNYNAGAAILTTLEPVDRADVYNTPVEILLRRY